jgi:hypothetical protein
MDCTAMLHSLDTDRAAASSRNVRKDSTLVSASRYRAGRDEDEKEEAALEEEPAIGSVDGSERDEKKGEKLKSHDTTK